MNAQPNLGMQVTTFENPLGIDGFEFVEFAAPAGQGEALHDYFRKLGFAILTNGNRAHPHLFKLADKAIDLMKKHSSPTGHQSPR